MTMSMLFTYITQFTMCLNMGYQLVGETLKWAMPPLPPDRSLHLPTLTWLGSGWLTLHKKELDFTVLRGTGPTWYAGGRVCS